MIYKIKQNINTNKTIYVKKEGLRQDKTLYKPSFDYIKK